MVESEISGQCLPKKARIMVVDDDPATHSHLQQMLVLNGSEMISFNCCPCSIAEAGEISADLILLATEGAGADGFQIFELLKKSKIFENTPVIFMSSSCDMSLKSRAFEAGGVDFLTKPVHSLELKTRINIHLHALRPTAETQYQNLIQNNLKEISAAQRATNFALAKLAEFRDEETGLHLRRVSEYCRILTSQLQKHSLYSAQISSDFIDSIQHASLLHDIGKVAIPDSILFKPSKLSFEEFEVMKKHTVIGAENIQDIYNNYSGNPLIGMGIEIALYHHERWDGQGYPDGLSERNIPLSARIMAVADFYDAVRSDRCYRKGFDHQQVKSMLVEGSGSHFDPVILQAFLETESEFIKVPERINQDPTDVNHQRLI